MAIVTKYIDVNAPLTEEELKMLEDLKNRPIVYDEDDPPLTAEQLAQFRRVNGQLHAERRKQTVTLRLSPYTLRKARALGKGYTSILSRIIEKALNDADFLKSCL